jgi:5'-nucleotidase
MLRVDERVDARGRTYFWVGFKRILTDPEHGTDLHAMAEGCISVTPLHMDLTDFREQQRMEGLIAGPLAALTRKPVKPGGAGQRRKPAGRLRKPAPLIEE